MERERIHQIIDSLRQKDVEINDVVTQFSELDDLICANEYFNKVVDEAYIINNILGNKYAQAHNELCVRAMNCLSGSEKIQFITGRK